MQKARGLALVPSRKLQLWTPLEREDNCFLQQKLIKEGQFSSVAQSCPTVYNPMNRSTPGLPIHHQLPESIQTHVHQVSDAIQPSHPLSSPSPPALNLSQHQGLFKWVSLHIRWPKYWSFSFSISLLRVSIFHNLFVRSNLDCQLIFKIFVLFPTWILFLGRNLS